MAKRQSSDQEYRFIVSKNGKHLLLMDGFAYRKYMTSKSSNHSYWTCTQRGCRAKGSLTPAGVFLLTKYLHNHAPDHREMQKKACIAKLRELALSTQMTNEQLLREVGMDLEDDPGRKYRAMINFWRWHAKRKQEMAQYHQHDQCDEMSYRFVRLENMHFLNFRNYYYRKYKSSPADEGSYWRCRYPHCPSRARILSDRSLSVPIFKHDHPEETVEGETVDQDLREQLRNVVLTTDMEVNEILALYGVGKNSPLKKYVKNLRDRKQRLKLSKQVEERSMEGEETEEAEEVEMDFQEELELEEHLDSIETLDDMPEGVVLKMPKDVLLLEEVGGSDEQHTVVPLDSLLKVVDEDGNEKTIMFKQEGDGEDGVKYQEIDLNDLTTLYVSDRDTVILNQ